MKTENISRRNFLKILGGIGALGLCGGISLVTEKNPQIEAVKTDRAITIKAEPIYKGVI